ncbi:MAG: FAD-dependent oxidoreductase [Hyphomonas oceanitis]|uniref:FAD-dependent oxidoreductase n=1 Tax=Hyphomonas oceanitis TaxID=81033 RepID=UPI003002C85E
MTMLTCQCCIAGGGPAGLMMGYLLARAGVDVIVLEKHADFLRDFRGDTVHPSTLQLFKELGLDEGLLTRPYQKTEHLMVSISGEPYKVADFSRLPLEHGFIAMMPQWDLLDFVADTARELPNFRLFMSTKAETLIEEDGKVAGLRAEGEDGPLEIRSLLTVAADGRDSRLRDQSGLEVEDMGAPIDVFWMRLPRKADAALDSMARADADGFLVLINRGDYWQCALPFPKGAADTIRAEGLEAFRERIGRLAPDLASATGAIGSWDDVKLLTVQMNRLKTWWRTGLLCIGDAAHAMSPIGGVGINLAVQDAVAAARMIAPDLREGRAPDAKLAAVQKRRDWPARMTQRAQIAAQDRVLVPVIRGGAPLKAPFIFKLIDRVPILRGLTARAVGMGLRPEHWPDDS